MNNDREYFKFVLDSIFQDLRRRYVLNQIELLKKRLSDAGYIFRGAPEDYDKSMRCESCIHFKRPYEVRGKMHGNCSQIDLGMANVFQVAGELDVAGEYICAKYEPKTVVINP